MPSLTIAAATERVCPSVSSGRASSAPSFFGNRQRRQKQSAPALYAGHPVVRDGDCRKRGYAGGCRAKRSGDTGHPCRYFGKAGICRFSGAKKEQKNGAASPFPRCSFPDHSAAGTTAIAASDCRVGVSPGRDQMCIRDRL